MQDVITGWVGLEGTLRIISFHPLPSTCGLPSGRPKLGHPKLLVPILNNPNSLSLSICNQNSVSELPVLCTAPGPVVQGKIGLPGGSAILIVALLISGENQVFLSVLPASPVELQVLSELLLPLPPLGWTLPSFPLTASCYHSNKL